MSDVFISYAHSTARQARAAAEALRALGYSVWLDEDLPAHRSFRPEIEQQLTAAMAALVIWSVEAATSDWVLSEASRAREARKLVQARVDRVRLPMPFDQIQCADLTGWSGDGNHRGWSKVAASLADLVKGRTPTPTEASAAAAPPAAKEPLLAVLAFDNHSGDPDLTYFSDGVSQEILDTVARGSVLKVIAPSSSFQLRGADKAVRRVAAELNATHLLDGSVRRAGSRVRISAHLVDCASETALWSDRFDREFTDIFALQDEIAEAAACALKVALAPTPKPSVIRPETYEAYLQAQPMVHKNMDYADPAALSLLERVVADAPTFAAAWENLALARAKLLRAGAATQSYQEARSGVVSAAETALTLDPTRGRAHLAVAFLEPWAAYARREAALDRALAANDNDALLMVWRARHFATLGQSRAGLDLAQKATALDPLVPFGRTMISGVLAQLGRYRDSLELWDSWGGGLTGSQSVTPLLHSAIMGDWKRFDAFEALQPAGELIGPTRRADAQFRRLFHNLRTSDRDAMRRSLARAQALVRETGTLPLNALATLELYGLHDDAYELVEAAAFDHMFKPDGPLPTTAVGPHVIFDSFRDGGLPRDPRFLRLCGKLGLVSYWIETDKWPDCADVVPYDFRAEARKVAAEGLAARV